VTVNLADEEEYDDYDDDNDDGDELHRDRVRWCSCTSVDLYFVDTGFKSRPGRRLS
jgi:hypothetical protein